MKLAEALILRADLQKRQAQLQQRMIQNARVQEGDQPNEDPSTLLAEYEENAQTLTRLIQNINRTNSQVELEAGQSLADALAVRDGIKSRHQLYLSLAGAASGQQNRYGRMEIKFVNVVNVAVLQKQADQLAKQHRELDSRIQAANWAVALLE